jgi:FMN phosphatase YigB (HAD superfamily)
MPLTLEQYATYLDTRSDVSWPAPPTVERPSAKPHLARLPEIRAVTWSAYGTLLAISGGQLFLEHPDAFMMGLALEKTVQEFKMWGSMSRKPGQPSEYLRQLYQRALEGQHMAPLPGEKHPEFLAARIWESILKKLLQKDYKFDTGFYGSLNEFSRKVAYFFHAGLQGYACYPDAALVVRRLKAAGIVQGLVADGQCFTLLQLQRGVARQDSTLRVDDLFEPALRVLSYEQRARKPADRIYRRLVSLLGERDLAPENVLHIGSSIPRDVVPARRLGLKTALFAGDRASLDATAQQLKDPAARPHIMLTELRQLLDVIG